MCFRVFGFLSVWSFVLALLSPSEVCAQYHWNRTAQNVWARSDSNAGVDIDSIQVWDDDFNLPGTPPDNDLAATSCQSTASLEDELGSSGSAIASVNGSSELNLDGQSTISWSFIHNQDLQLEAVGNAVTQGAAIQQTSVNTTAVLEEDVPTEGTTGRLDLNIGWVALEGGEWCGWKVIDISIGFGNAWLNVTGNRTEYLIAQGTDGYGNWLFKTSNSPLDSATGSLVIGGTEFTSPLQANAPAFIRCNQPVSSVRERNISNWDLTDAEIFQGVIAIGAGS